MTAPVLSLIVPNHNHTDRLSGLLDSVLAQSFKNLEVILVDDCSESSCAPIVEAYRNKGLSISLLEHQQRVYILHARLAGIRAARGQIIAFADADDILCGENAMERNVELFLRHKPEILHFRYLIADRSGAFVRYAHHEAGPHKALLCGEDVFSFFAQSDFHHMAPLWNKYYSRDLCDILTRIDHTDNLTCYCNDLYFNSLLFYHAKKYTGSEFIGYSHIFDESTYIEKSKGRAVAFYQIMNFMCTYLTNNKCNKNHRDQYNKSIFRGMALEIGRVCRDIYKKHNEHEPVDVFDSFLAHADERTWMKILLLGNGYNANKIGEIYHTII